MAIQKQKLPLKLPLKIPQNLPSKTSLKTPSKFVTFLKGQQEWTLFGRQILSIFDALRIDPDGYGMRSRRCTFKYEGMPQRHYK